MVRKLPPIDGRVRPLANESLRPYFTIVNKGIYVVMGVSGSGKSLIGAKVARALDIDFVEGDDFHSTLNIERMRSGIPLTDDDRAEWLRTIARRIRESILSGVGVVISCSALKRSYRDMIRSQADHVQFIFLDGKRAMIAERIADRGSTHFMPPSLLDDQLATLERPSPDECAWIFDISQSSDEIITAVLARSQGENP